MKELVKVLIIFLIGIMTASCATILSGTKQEIRFNSSPSGAKVIVNGKDMGLTTPCVATLKRKVKPGNFNNRNEYHYLFLKEGYANTEFIDYRRINPKLYYNFLFYGAFVITLPVDFLSGAAYKYKDQVMVNLSPVQYNPVIVNNEDIKVKNLDKSPPVIKIIKPDLARGFKLTVKEEVVEVVGIATDESGIFDVIVNGVSADLSNDGRFTASIILAEGANRIHVVARDKKMNIASESFYLEKVSEIVDIGAKESDIPETGNYHALIIGVADYLDPTISDLDEPVNDAQKLYNTLLGYYEFGEQNIMMLKNPTRDEITQALEDYFNKLTNKDNLLVFFAGHGYWDEKFRQGYWLPADARFNNRGTWLSNSTIRDYMRAISCKHNLLISDACFAGGIFKSREAFSDASRAIKELYQLPSRKAMTSGALNKVPDKSVFLEYLIKRLEENQEKYLSAEQLFASFKIAVINNSPENQVPQFGEVKETGDEGGDFIFIRK